MNRLHHLVPPALVALVGLWVAWISFTQEPADAFLFPRLISSVFAVLAIWTLARAVMGDVGKAEGITLQMLKNLGPGIVVMAIYVFWAAKTFGFYPSTAIATFALIALYDPAPHDVAKSWIKRATVTAGFIGVMYLIFTILLGP